MNTVLIIGANSDIAYALALQLAKTFQPQLFLLASQDSTTLNQTANDIHIRTKIAIQTYSLDLKNQAACTNFYAQIADKPDCIAYCAGYLGDETKAEQDPEEAQKILAINYTGAMLLLEAAAADFAEKKQGVIIGISSVAGIRGRKKNYHYGAAKAAFTTYLSGLRNRLTSAQVQVITVLPGFVDTKMVRHLSLPKKLTATPDQVAATIIQAIQHKKDVVYVKSIWRLIMWVITQIPEKMFKKMDL